MSLLLDALKRAEQEKLARLQGEGPGEAAPAAPPPAHAAAPAPATTASILELQPLARAAAASNEAQAKRDAETAQKVFAAKAATQSSRRTTLWALAAGILLIVAGGGAYFWYSLNALAPKTTLRAAPLPPVPSPPVAANPAPTFSPPGAPVAAAPATGPGPIPAEAPAAAARVAVVPAAPVPVSPAAAREQLALSLVQEAARAEPAPVRLAPSSDGPRVSPRVSAGYEALRNGQLEEARQSYAAALSADPGSTDAALGLATVEARSGNASAAASLYRKALELDPRNPTALAGLASLSDFSRPDTVEMQLRTDLSRDPQSAPLNVALGNLYASQGRWTEAQAAFFEAHRIEPGGPDILYNLAVSLDRMGQTRAAIPYYRRALEAARGRSTPFDPAVVSRRLAEIQR